MQNKELSQGELIWLNIRKSISMEQLKTVVQMLNGLGGFSLTDKDIDKVCNTDDDIKEYSESNRVQRLINPKTGSEEEVSFDEFLILYRIYSGETIFIDFDNDDNFITNYSFDYEGKHYTPKDVSHLLNNLSEFFNFGVEFNEKNIKKSRTYLTLKRKATALIKLFSNDYLSNEVK